MEQNVILDPLKEAFNNMGIQIISFVIIIVAAYYGAYLLLSLVKLPRPIKKFISAMVMLVTIYFSWLKIFAGG